MFILAADEPVVHDEIMADIYLCSYFSILYPALADSGRRGEPDGDGAMRSAPQSKRCGRCTNIESYAGFCWVYQVLICITNYCHERAFEEVYLAY